MALAAIAITRSQSAEGARLVLDLSPASSLFFRCTDLLEPPVFAVLLKDAAVVRQAGTEDRPKRTLAPALRRAGLTAAARSEHHLPDS